MKTILNYKHLSVILCSLVGFTLPFKHNLNSIAIILLALHTILTFKFSHTDGKLNLNNPLVLFFILCFLGLIYTENINEGLRYLKRVTPFLVFPFAFSVLKFHKGDQRKILWSFCGGLFIISIYLLIGNSIKHFYRGVSDIWYYSRYTELIDIHPAYLVMFLILAIFFLFETSRRQLLGIKKWSVLVLLLFFSLQIFFIQSRVGIFSLIIITLIYTLLLYAKFLRKILVFGVTALVLVFILIYHLDLFQRLEDIPKDALERIQIWQGAFEAFKESPLIGYGTGDVQTALDLGNFLTGGDYFVYFKYNTHNQYLDVLLRFGIFGLGILLILYYKGYKIYRESRDRLFLVFLTMSILFFLTENILFRQRGIVFFSFFYAMFTQFQITSNEN